MPFRRIETQRKSAHAARQLIDAIKEGVYRVGDRLPPERELAEKMGISRPLLREALSALHLAGVIESRAGDGTYIRRGIGGAEIEARVLAVLEEDQDPLAVFEARLVLEPGAARLAARRITDEGLTELESILTSERRAAQAGDYVEYVDADRRFHLAIAGFTGNPFLQAAIQPLVNFMGRRLWGEIDKLFLFTPTIIKSTISEHRAVFEALKKKAPAEAEAALKAHLENAQVRYLGEDQERKGG